MADSYRLEVLKSLTAVLQGIKHIEGDPDNNWDGFDLSNAVFRGRSVYGDDSPETFLSILEAPRPGPDNTAGHNGEARKEEWPLLLQGFVQDDKLNPLDPVYPLLDVVERRLSMITAVRPQTGNPLYPSLYMLGNKVSSFTFGPGVARPPAEGVSSKAFFYMQLSIGLAKVR